MWAGTQARNIGIISDRALLKLTLTKAQTQRLFLSERALPVPTATAQRSTMSLIQATATWYFFGGFIIGNIFPQIYNKKILHTHTHTQSVYILIL